MNNFCVLAAVGLKSVFLLFPPIVPSPGKNRPIFHSVTALQFSEVEQEPWLTEGGWASCRRGVGGNSVFSVPWSALLCNENKCTSLNRGTVEAATGHSGCWCPAVFSRVFLRQTGLYVVVCEQGLRLSLCILQVRLVLAGIGPSCLSCCACWRAGNPPLSWSYRPPGVLRGCSDEIQRLSKCLIDE